ncbi:MAG: hypothetical protein FGM14_16635 [Flavobacteriales bacterium]|nr:hypothetical protein [Flavobacteriales bacterium]
MSNYLKIFDFHLSHKIKGNNVTFFDLGIDKEFNKTTSVKTNSEKIHREIVLKGFENQFSSDLNSEKLKNNTTKRIVKKCRDKNSQKIVELSLDKENLIIYGLLFSGRITKNVTLEKVNDDGNNNYETLNRHRIYDNFFFLMHISFRCNVARVFIHTKTDSVPGDAIIKKYLLDHLFKSNGFNKTKVSDFISAEFKKEVLNRSVIGQISISKTDTIQLTDDGEKFDVEVRLKPKTQSAFKDLTENIVNLFKKTKVIIGNQKVDDLNSTVKISLNDALSKTNKTIVFGDEEGFQPKILLNDNEILNGDEIDLEVMKNICMSYVIYDKDKLKKH